MRSTISTAITPARWRRRRAARIALACALVVAAPFVGGPDSDPSGQPNPGADAAPADAGPARVSGTGSPESPGQGVLAGEPLRVVPVPLADPGVADVLQAGDLVDLVAVDPEAHPDPGRGPVLVASGARVRDTPAGGHGTRSVLVEVPQSRAAALAATAAGTPLAVIVHG